MVHIIILNILDVNLPLFCYYLEFAMSWKKEVNLLEAQQDPRYLPCEIVTIFPEIGHPYQQPLTLVLIPQFLHEKAHTAHFYQLQ